MNDAALPPREQPDAAIAAPQWPFRIAEEIAQERISQIVKWGTLHDDGHTDGSLAKVAAALLCYGTDAWVTESESVHDDYDNPWGLIEKHKDNPRHMLIIATALAMAEIERRDLAMLSAGGRELS